MKYLFQDHDADICDEEDLWGEGRHSCDIRKQAMDCLEGFFLNKSYWAGGHIPNGKLFTQDNVNVVVQTTVMTALEIAYTSLERSSPENWNIQQKNWDVILCYEILNECAHCFIPKCFAGGILLVYLALCQGIDYSPVMKELTDILGEKFTVAI